MHLYISDLDKTLLNDHAQLSTYAKDELNRMIAEGLHFTIATARSHVSSRKILDGLDIQLPVVVANGSFLADYETGEIIEMMDIQEQLKKEALSLILKNNIQPFVSATNGTILKLFYHQINNAGLKWYFNDLAIAKDPRVQQLADIHEALKWNIVSFTVIEKKEKVEQLSRQLEKYFPNLLDMHFYENPYQKGWYWMSIHHKEATKGNMIQTFIDTHDISPKQVSVFGDNVNDIPMFEFADHGLAVSNAVDALKSKATKIIGSNMDHGVVHHIKSEFYHDIPQS